jgi:hypothetical protein
VLLGSTRIGVVRASDAVEKTEVRQHSPLDRKWLSVPALMGVAAAEALFGWLQADELKLLKLIADEILPVLLGLAVWALGWAIASRIAQGTFRYVAHLTVAALAVGAVRGLRVVVLPAFGFWLNLSPPAVRTLEDLATLVLAGWALGQHLSRTGPWSLRRSYGVAALIMVAVGLPWELTQLAKSGDFDTDLSIPRDALPPAAVLRTSSMKDFLRMTESLQREADALRHKR